eukprot:TRINITY_DN16458_c0_g1_i1.p1 TRINITY_DN16458_c0_g1~~TRINITY_DN16458_c0_g1_i1.p1  ORF type:complete len:195 (-),score=26.66 TRINITY_DN16458_c0_g1_i1:307-891(-)
MLDKGFPAPDPQTALRYYQESATAGYPKAQFNLGVMYKKGEEVPRDEKKAAMYLEMAASCGHRQSMIVLARMYAQGSGVSKDYLRAVHYYETAYRLHADPLREKKLFNIFVKGKHFPLNYRKACLYGRTHQQFRQRIWDPLFKDDTWEKAKLLKEAQIQNKPSFFNQILPEIVDIIQDFLLDIYFCGKQKKVRF